MLLNEASAFSMKLPAREGPETIAALNKLISTPLSLANTLPLANEYPLQ
ncbi:hypothetical protein [Bradyrhizobium sp. DASA03007]